MIILLYGKDSYRARQKLEEIIGQYQKVHKKGLSLTCCSAKDLRVEDLKNIFDQSSIFDEKKLVVLSGVFSSKVFKEEFSKKLESFLNSKSILVIFEEAAVMARDSLLAVLKKKAKAQAFDLLDERETKKWIKEKFLKLETEVDSGAVEKLAAFVGNDLWRLDNEIKKLASYKKKGKVLSEDVSVLVRPKIETDIFKTIDAIAQKNKKTAISLIHEHLRRGDSPNYLLYMITYQFRNLLAVKELMESGFPYYAIPKKTKLHPFVVKKSYQLASKFSFEELKKIYRKIFQIDFSIKTGKIKPELAFDLLLTEI